MAAHIVILGGGFAGLTTAHKLLRLTIPQAQEAKITLISESDHLYWNLASVRAVIPDEIPDHRLFRPISEGFTQYPDSRFALVIGKAISVDFTKQTVAVQASGGPSSVSYDQLVLATGASLPHRLPFKHVGSTDETIAALHAMQSRVKKAQSIVIAGSGPTGVETMGELGHAYGGQKKLTLIVSGERVLSNLMPSVGKATENELAKMNVDLIHQVTVTSVHDDNGATTLTLSSGQTLTTDLYIPLFGMSPNTTFLPPEILDDHGNVKLARTLRVQGQQNVWGVGDIGNLETKQATKIDPQVKQLVQNLAAVLAGNPGGVTSYVPSEKPMIGITIGKSKGTGQMGGLKMFSWLVWWLKGRTLLVEKAEAMVMGQ